MSNQVPPQPNESNPNNAAAVAKWNNLMHSNTTLLADSYAPNDAPYVITTSNAALPNAQSLAALSGGFLKIGTNTGVMYSTGSDVIRPSDMGASGVTAGTYTLNGLPLFTVNTSGQITSANNIGALATDTGSSTHYILNTSPPIVSSSLLVNGLVVSFVPLNQNTTNTPVASVNGSSNYSIFLPNGAQINIGDMPVNGTPINLQFVISVTSPGLSYWALLNPFVSTVNAAVIQGSELNIAEDISSLLSANQYSFTGTNYSGVSGAYNDGADFTLVRIQTTNTGAVTFSGPQQGSFVSVVTPNGSPLVGGEIVAGVNRSAVFKWNSIQGNWVLMNSALATQANLTGDVTSVGTATTVVKINGTSLAGLSTGILKNTTTTGVPSIAVAADFPTLNQNTSGSAGSVAAANITGTTLASGVTASSLTSFGTSPNINSATGTSLTLNSGTALAHYIANSWSPVGANFTFSGVGGTAVWSTSYARIGRILLLTATLTNSNGGTTTSTNGVSSITGLPIANVGTWGVPCFDQGAGSFIANGILNGSGTIFPPTWAAKTVVCLTFYYLCGTD